jgi:tetratricopeptide (TPR) repeat protein
VREEYLATGNVASPLSILVEAEIALRLDEIEQAGGLFQEALEDARGDEERARAFEGLGQIAFCSGDRTQAVDLLERTVALLSDDLSEHPALAERLARVYAAIGQRAHAIALLERCLESVDDPVRFVRFAALLSTVLIDNGSWRRQSVCSRPRPAADGTLRILTRAPGFTGPRRVSTQRKERSSALDAKGDERSRSSTGPRTASR